MRHIIILTFCCFLGSCAYLDGIFLEDTPDSAGTSPYSEDNSTADQSKQVQVKVIRDQDFSNSIQALTPIEVFIAGAARMPIFRAADLTHSELYSFEYQNKFHLISVSTAGHVLYWSPQNSWKKAVQVVDIQEGFTALAFSPSSFLLAASYPDRTLIYDLSESKQVYSMTRLRTRVVSMDFNPAGQSLLMAGADGVIYHWQFVLESRARGIADQEKVIERYIGHSTVVNTVRFHPFGRTFISTDWGGVLNAWLLYSADRYDGRFDSNIFAGRFFTESVNRVRGARTADSIVEQVRFSKDGQFFYTADESGNMEIWQVRGFKRVASIAAHDGKIQDFCLAPGEEVVFTIGRDGKLKKWQIKRIEKRLSYLYEYELELLHELPSSNAERISCLSDNAVISTGAGGRLIFKDLRR